MIARFFGQLVFDARARTCAPTFGGFCKYWVFFFQKAPFLFFKACVNYTTLFLFGMYRLDLIAHLLHVCQNFFWPSLLICVVVNIMQKIQS